MESSLSSPPPTRRFTVARVGAARGCLHHHRGWGLRLRAQPMGQGVGRTQGSPECCGGQNRHNHCPPPPGAHRLDAAPRIGPAKRTPCTVDQHPDPWWCPSRWGDGGHSARGQQQVGVWYQRPTSRRAGEATAAAAATLDRCRFVGRAVDARDRRLGDAGAEADGRFRPERSRHTTAGICAGLRRSRFAAGRGCSTYPLRAPWIVVDRPCPPSCSPSTRPMRRRPS